MAKSNQQEQFFRAILAKAVLAGRAAGDAAVPVPMIVQERANPLNDASPVVKQYAPVMGGVCGFAWIKVRPANKAFAKWLKAEGLARPAYEGGLDISISEYGQSMERKSAHAYAMAKVLQDAFPDMQFYAQDRMD